MQTFILFLITFAIWAVGHSLTASLTLKQKMIGRFGQVAYDGLYRLGYNLFALLTFIPVFYFWSIISSPIVWALQSPYQQLFLSIRFIGMIGIVYSLWQTDVWSFAGIRQAVAFLQHKPTPNEFAHLIISGPYKWVRHPLYFFSLLLLWFHPTLTVNGLLFSLFATLYFYIGSIYEERKLRSLFGEQYATYQETTPRLIPFLPF